MFQRDQDGTEIRQFLFHEDKMGKQKNHVFRRKSEPEETVGLLRLTYLAIICLENQTSQMADVGFLNMPQKGHVL